MTDKETLIAMLNRAGVGYEVSEDEGGTDKRPSSAIVTAEAEGFKEDAPNRGYVGFFAVFYFDEHGALEAVGAWE